MLSFNLFRSIVPAMVDPNIIPLLVEGKDPSHAALETQFAQALLEMYQSAPPEVREGLRIFSGHRSDEHQARLFADAVKKYGSEAAARKWVAPPGRSRHNSGRAADLKYASPAVQEWIHANAANFGLGFPMDHEPWHLELAGERQKAVRPATPADVGGMPGMEMAVSDGRGGGGAPETPSQQPENGLGALFAGLGAMGTGQGASEPSAPAAGLVSRPQTQIEVGGPAQPAQPVTAAPVENTDLGSLLQHISGGLRPPPSPAPRPGSRRLS